MKYLQRSNNIYCEIYNFKALHGGLASWLYPGKLSKAPKVSHDIKVITVTNYYTYPILRQYEQYSSNISLHTISVPQFNCWIDKIKPVLDYIKTIQEPYVMWIDATDTIIVDDILDPKHILDTYDCKILFNAEDGYGHPGHPCDSKPWLYDGYYNANRIEDVHTNKNKLLAKTKTDSYIRSLNAGLYLSEREFLINCLDTILRLMQDDPIKGYPYGESDDQILWQYLMAKDDKENIQIDYNNLYFFRGGTQHLEFEPHHWEHFNYFNNKLKK